ncbi:hypothetical protein QE419_000621 [Brevundimonas vesicularis]|jgi:hypothetical protein|uniref:hypothetical protein n=1 Tax=Brevundimonas vesicularis TaxID=41276 RepID=UPI0027859A6E|nr:hypothetical protein [Brevundimonas vesicularis]MDQ1191855.1 hypothetical protein [Brevundimonas vesicularis]
MRTPNPIVRRISIKLQPDNPTPFQRMWSRLKIVLLGILITSVLAFCGRLAGVG